MDTIVCIGPDGTRLARDQMLNLYQHLTATIYGRVPANSPEVMRAWDLRQYCIEQCRLQGDVHDLTRAWALQLARQKATMICFDATDVTLPKLFGMEIE